jgi:hypothetical protein
MFFTHQSMAKISIWDDLPKIRLETTNKIDFRLQTFKTINVRIHALHNEG